MLVSLGASCRDEGPALSPSLVSWQSELVAMEIIVGLNEVKVHECCRDGHERWTPELMSSRTAADAAVPSNPLLGLDTSGSSDRGRSPVGADYSRCNDSIRFKKVCLSTTTIVLVLLTSGSKW